MSKRSVSLASIAAILAASMAVHAQSGPVCTPGVSGYNQFFGGIVLKGAYIAKTKSTVEQRLADGNTIRGVVHTQQARDASGKTLTQYPQGCYLDENAQPQVQMSVNIYDPATKISESWTIGDLYSNKVVRIVHPSVRQPAAKLTPEELAARNKAMERRQPPKSEFKTEDLGTRTIAGTEAKGSRTIRTIPPGEEGNDSPLVVVNETWHSREMGITVLASSDDPRYGRKTFEVEELSRSEPDAKLFLPPPDYKVVDQTPPPETVVKQ